MVSQRHPDSGVNDGLFGVAYTIRDRANTSTEHQRLLTDLLTWFTTHLTVPDRFNRSSSKGYYRRNSKGIAWFRDTAVEHISRMHELRRIAEANGYEVSVIAEERIGYIVYRCGAGYCGAICRYVHWCANGTLLWWSNNRLSDVSQLPLRTRRVE